ncbi:MAG: S-layer homology domain-containing protein, partial [Candidatus Sericytochromatia bacterium]
MHLRLIAATVLTVPALALVAQAAPQFRDIPEGHWAQRPAGLLAEAGIMPGRTALDFAGTAPITRYELAHIVSELYDVSGPPSTFIVLQDMRPGHAMTQEVQRVIGFGLMQTRKPGQFAGDAPASKLEVVKAFHDLLDKMGKSPPARRAQPAVFSDVPPGSEFGQVLERIVNRFGLLDGRSGTRFNPYNTLTRYEMLSMVVRSLVYFNPTLASALQAPAPSPTPEPGASPAASPAASPKPSPGPKASPSPGASPVPGTSPAPAASPTPEPAFPAQPILKTRGFGQVEVLLNYSEVLPTEAGAVSPSEQQEFAGALLGGGALGGEYWMDKLGFGLTASSYYVPVDITVNGAVQPNDIIDTIGQAHGAYKLLGGADWEAALGGGALFRYTYNMTAQGATYLTTDKTYLGLGPVLVYGYR